MRRFAFLALTALMLHSAQAGENKVLSYWEQLGPGGSLEVRAIMSGTECPEVSGERMSVRAAATADFPLLCSMVARAHATRLNLMARGDMPGGIVADFVDGGAAYGGFDLPRIVREPKRILVLGDTGCRIKGTLVQACNDTAQWPFRQLAEAAAKLEPDLVIHVGDYLYRETPCPAGNAGCVGSPYGDNWAAWNEDFFDRAQPLLAAAPWVFVRGNHEDCSRSGPGFLRLLGPAAFDPNAPCTDHQAPYDVPLGALNLVVMDNANAPDTSVDPSVVPTYNAEFTALAKEPRGAWLLMHRPIWGAVSGPLGIPVGGNQTMIAALAGQPIPKPIALMLAGHIHSFEALNYGGLEPPTMLSGNGGDLLDSVPADLDHTQLGGKTKVSDGLSVKGFGFFLMTKAGETWNIDLYDAAGTQGRRCLFAAGRVDCGKP
jgi:hypothetical protein